MAMNGVQSWLVAKSNTLDVLPIFRTEIQARLLALLLLQPERRFKGVELAGLTNRIPQTVSKELRRLERAGVVEVEEMGTAKLYRAAADSPFYEHLRGLVELALGPEIELRRQLEQISGVEVAVIFGSWASGTRLRPTSDVDLLVVGTPNFDELVAAAAEVERLAAREIHIIPYTWQELDDRIARDSGFVKNMLAGPLTPLVGDPNLLRKRVHA